MKSSTRFITLILVMMSCACSTSIPAPTATASVVETETPSPPTNTPKPATTPVPHPTSTPQPCSQVDFNGVWYGTRILLETNDVLATTLTLEQSGCVVTGRYDGDVAGKIEGQIDTDGVLTILDDELEMRYELGEDILVGVVLDAGAAHTGDDVLEKVAEERINIIE